MADQAPDKQPAEEANEAAVDTAPDSAERAAASEDGPEKEASATKAIGMVIALLVLTVAALQFLNPGVEEARKAQDMANLTQIGEALKAYQQMNEGLYPANLRALYPQYIQDPTVLVQPERQPYGPYPNSGEGLTSDYLYLPPQEGGPGMVAFRRQGAMPDPEGRHVLMGEGEVKWLTEAEFKGFLKKELAARSMPTDEAQVSDDMPEGQKLHAREFLKEFDPPEE